MTECQPLCPGEVEGYVQEIEKFSIKDIITERWKRQHVRIHRLNMQAVAEARRQETETVREAVVNYDKVGHLIHEAIATEAWKQKVFPAIVALGIRPITTFPLYTVLYHEASVVNLLETLLYHADVGEAAADACLDLLDYCYSKLARLVSSGQCDSSKRNEEVSEHFKELIRQNEELEFNISMRATSIISYITDHLSMLPLSVTSRLLTTHNVPALLVELVENAPWRRRGEKGGGGGEEKYIDDAWQAVEPADRLRLTKLEGQVWLALYRVLLDPNCQQKYEFNSYNKNLILKLRPHLNAAVLDQIPNLAQLQRLLEELAIMDVPPTKPQLVLEQVPEMRAAVLRAHEGRWEELARSQAKFLLQQSKKDMREDARRLASAYDIDTLESVMCEPPRCALCGQEAAKRCSRCRNEWYCRRECQVDHWNKHKIACDLMADPGK